MINVLQQRFLAVLTERISKYLRLDYEIDGPDSAVGILAHEIFESFALCDAARYLGLMDEEHVLHLFDPFFASFNRFGTVAGSHFPEFVKHSWISLELVRDFPDFSYLLESRMRSGDHSFVNLGLRFPELHRKLFCKLMLLQIGMLEQPSTKAYSEAVRYASDQKWARLLEGRPSPEETLKASESDEMTTPSVYHGFMSLLGTMAEINTSLRDGATREESADLTRLAEYVRNTFNWRIDIRSAGINKRFDQLRKYILQDATQEVHGVAKYSLQQKLEEILDEVAGSVAA